MKVSLSVCACLILLFATGVPSLVGAEEVFPARPITVINPLPAGGPTDLVLRMLAEKASKVAGQPVVVVNKPGGNFVIGVMELQNARPDGYTVGYLTPAALFTMPHTEQIPYHPIKDFKPIIQYGQMNFGIAVNFDAPYKSWKELVDAGKTRKLRFGHSGPRSMQGVVVNLMAKDESISLINIPYKGSPEFQTALMGGHVDIVAGDFSYSLVEAKKIRPILMLSDARSPFYPDIECMKEVGFDYPVPVPFILMAKKDTPEPIVKRLEEIFTKAAKDPDYIKGVKDIRLIPTYRSAAEAAVYLRESFDRMGDMIKRSGLSK